MEWGKTDLKILNIPCGSFLIYAINFVVFYLGAVILLFLVDLVEPIIYSQNDGILKQRLPGCNSAAISI